MDSLSSSPDRHHADKLSAEPTLPAMPPPLTSLAGTKRPAPTLLPPFEPSSSPGLPRPVKRQNISSYSGSLKYPTPIPTSSTGILSSSPPRHAAATERVPLSAVPTVELSENGETLIMGRSSNSSHFQLSTNRVISRVHVKARFIPAPSLLEPSKVEIICNGWNGLKLHCQSQSWELFKGDTFTSETEGCEIMVDVHDARVLIQWPKRVVDGNANLTDGTWDESPTQPRRDLQPSPVRRGTRITSPESPTPVNSSSRRLQALLPGHRNKIRIYEDEPDLPVPKLEPEEPDVNASMRTEATASFSSSISEEDLDPNEENDPYVHSFGPFGADLSGRFASISTKSPKVTKDTPKRPNPLMSSLASSLFAPRLIPSNPGSPTKKMLTREEKDDSPLSSPPRVSTPTPEPPQKSIEVNSVVANHVVNQLAYSRLSSTPLSTIMLHLPNEEKEGLDKEELRETIENTPCIGIITRQGKDAAGKLLESEYYYIPEHDMDDQRRAAVVDGLRKPSLRACRKQHKVC